MTKNEDSLQALIGMSFFEPYRDSDLSKKRPEVKK